MAKTLQELTIKDDFMFSAVMAEEENCRGLLELATDISVGRVEVSREKSFAYDPEYKASGWMSTRKMRRTPGTTWRCRC